MCLSGQTCANDWQCNSIVATDWRIQNGQNGKTVHEIVYVM